MLYTFFSFFRVVFRLECTVVLFRVVLIVVV